MQKNAEAAEQQKGLAHLIGKRAAPGPAPGSSEVDQVALARRLRQSDRAAADSLAAILEADLSAPPLFDSTTTLEDYLAVAMKRSPRLRAAYNHWLADLRKSDHVGGLPDPVFSYTWFVENVETRVEPVPPIIGPRIGR